MNVSNLDIISQKSIEKATKRAENIKDALVFDLNYTPERIYVRKEMEKIMDYLAEYIVLGIPQNIIVYGSRGSGKTVCIRAALSTLLKKADCNSFYVSVREHSTSYKIYQEISNEKRRGFSISEIREMALKKITNKKTIIVLDEVDFLKDYDILYHLSRSTKATLICLTQKTGWYKEINDESIKSSMQPIHINFKEYNADEIYEILKLRVEDGLYNWDDAALHMLAGLVVRDNNSDARVGIRACYVLGLLNDWSEKNIYEAIKIASKEVEEIVISGLKDRDLIILYALAICNETNKAYTMATKNISNIEGSTLSKKHFFRILNYLQNIGLISLIKKRCGRYYTLEVQFLLSDPTLIKGEIKRRLNFLVDRSSPSIELNNSL